MDSNGRSMRIKKAFGERTYQKGTAYFEDGMVVDLVVDGDRVVGKVIGGGREAL